MSKYPPDYETGYATRNVTAATAQELDELRAWVDGAKPYPYDPDGVRVCPVRGCKGHEGPHGSLFAQTWTGDKGDCE